MISFETQERKKSIEVLLNLTGNHINDFKDLIENQEKIDVLNYNLKNICNNLKSVLEYIIHEILDKKLPTSMHNKNFIFFPIWENIERFDEAFIKDEKLKFIKDNEAFIFEEIKNVQPFNDSEKIIRCHDDSGNILQGDINIEKFKVLHHLHKINNQYKHSNIILSHPLTTITMHASFNSEPEIGPSPPPIHQLFIISTIPEYKVDALELVSHSHKKIKNLWDNIKNLL